METTHLFSPLKLKDLILKNRIVVSPMQQYIATDGLVNNWHLVHLGSRAIGGASLNEIITSGKADLVVLAKEFLRNPHGLSNYLTLQNGK